MNPYKKIEQHILDIVGQLQSQGALPNGLSLDKVEATPPRDASHGDVATNVAMVLAGQAGMKPRDIAELIINTLPLRGRVRVGASNSSAEHHNAPLPTSPLLGEEMIEAADIAGPGFINLTLKPSVWQQAVAHINQTKTDFGASDIGKNTKVNVEYVSANPTGPMHVGHGRGAVFGDALCGLLEKAGYDVTREYYINDAGAQVDVLTRSAYLRYREACGETIEIPEGLYPGEYLIPVGQMLKDQHGDALLAQSEEQWMPVVRTLALEQMMQLIKNDLASMGVHHDIFTSERELTEAGAVEKAIKTLEDKGLVYTGVLEPPKGKVVDDWEARPQTLFKATQFGDDVDRPIKKSDGSWTYFAPDIAYHFDKCNRGYDVLIDVFGADHGGYVKRLKAAVNALSGGKVPIDVKLMQMIKLLRGGEPAKMSKRAGNFITIREVVEEVGKDVLRFIMLTRKNDAPLDFDFEKVLEQSKDNPVFYVQYAHARACSVLRRGESEGHTLADADLAKLTHPAELALVKTLCNWPRLVEQAARAFEPHRVAFYLQEVAAEFHSLWNLGNDDPGLRFIQEQDKTLTAARLALTEAVTHVIASGLGVLGVEPAHEMR